MNEQRRVIRQEIENWGSLEEYQALLAKVKLTPIERKICDLHYLSNLYFMEIAEEIGYSESGVKKLHKKILEKIVKSTSI